MANQKITDLVSISTIADTDLLTIVDISEVNPDDQNKKMTIGQLEGRLIHDNLAGFVANEHVDHSAVSITAGTGLTGGGTIAASRTINADLAAINYWTKSGSDLSYTAGNVEVGGILNITNTSGRFTTKMANATGTSPSLHEWRLLDETGAIWARIGKQSSASDGFTFGDVSVSDQVDSWRFKNTHVLIDEGLSIGTTASPNQKLTIEGTMDLKEQASANADTAGYLQLWAKTGTPNEFWWTDDAGNDRQAVYAGGAFHDGFSDFVADEHVAHSGVSITAGNGLTGGGTIAATRTLNVGAGNAITVDSNSVAVDFFAASVGTTTTMSPTDTMLIHRLSYQNITFANFEGAINHDSLAGFVANEHINHTSVSISTQHSLTGGGTIAATRTLNLVNDVASPGNNKVYGTDGVGARGWQDSVGTSGTYTPTYTGVLNVASVTHHNAYYMKIGDVVIVSGAVTIDPSAGGTTTRLRVSLPVAATFANAYDCSGQVSQHDINHSYTGDVIYADATNNEAVINFYYASNTNEIYRYTFMYVI